MPKTGAANPSTNVLICRGLTANCRASRALAHDGTPCCHDKCTKNVTWSHDDCKLRLRDHKLKIEVGRHSKTPLDERICKACSLNEIEDEVHFLYNCTAYCNTLTQEGHKTLYL